jgi:hypothetical protein
MIDQGIMTEEALAPDGIAPPDAPNLANGENLEQRVHRLEDAVAALQDTRAVEDRVAERVSRRLNRKTAPGATDPAGVMASARQLFPAAVEALRTTANHAEAHAQANASPSSGHPPWLVVEAYAEARAMVRMYVDQRYSVSWVAKVMPIVLLVAIFTSWVWLPGTMIIYSPFMTLVDKAVDLVLAFLTFKILSREVRRYRAAIADHPVAKRVD